MTRQHIFGAATAIGLLSFSASWAQVPSTTPPAPSAPSIPAQPSTPAPNGASPSQTTPPSPSADWRRSMPSDQQITDAVNARIAVLKADLRLNGEQQGHWGQLETTLRDSAVGRVKQRMEREARMMAEREEFREQMRRWRDEQRNRTDGTRSDPPQRPWQMNDLESMKEQSRIMAARADEMRRIADAASPLYASLDDRQRRMLMDGMRRLGDSRMGRRGGDRDGRWRDNGYDDYGGRDGRRDWRN